MNKFKCILPFLLCLLPMLGLAEDITVVGPPGKIKADSWEPIVFRGVSAEELTKIAIEVTPNKGVAVMLMNSIGGDNVIWFRSSEQGQSYTITVGMNRWRQGLDSGLNDAKKAKIAPADLALIENAVDTLAKKYPIKVGSALVEVAGTLPPPVVVNPPVVVPPVVTTGKRKVFIVHETGDQSWRQGAAITSLRDGTNAEYLKTKGHRLYILDPNSKDENNNPSPLLKPRLEAITRAGLTLPAMVVEDYDSGSVLSVVKAPDPPDANKIVELIKQAGG